MKFQKYPTLLNSNEVAKGKLNKHAEVLSGEFYATEKIHGTNFAIHYTATEVRYAKRTGFIEDGELFFKYEEFFNSYDLDWIRIARKDFDAYRIIVFGEFYGGTIQPMEYRESLEGVKNFRVFNIMIQDLEDDPFYVLGYDEMLELAGADRLAPYEAKGNIWDLLKTLDLKKESQLGGGSEGYVLQPYTSRKWLPTEPFFGVKHKTEKFSEVKPETLTALVGSAATLFDLQRYVTEARYWNLVSKGDIEPIIENVGALIDAYIDDVFQEYEGDRSALEGKEQEFRGRLKSPVARLIYPLVREAVGEGK